MTNITFIRYFSQYMTPVYLYNKHIYTHSYIKCNNNITKANFPQTPLSTQFSREFLFFFQYICFSISLRPGQYIAGRIECNTCSIEKSITETNREIPVWSVRWCAILWHKTCIWRLGSCRFVEAKSFFYLFYISRILTNSIIIIIESKWNLELANKKKWYPLRL